MVIRNNVFSAWKRYIRDSWTISIGDVYVHVSPVRIHCVVNKEHEIFELTVSLEEATEKANFATDPE